MRRQQYLANTIWNGSSLSPRLLHEGYLINTWYVTPRTTQITVIRLQQTTLDMTCLPIYRKWSSSVTGTSVRLSLFVFWVRQKKNRQKQRNATATAVGADYVYSDNKRHENPPRNKPTCRPRFANKNRQKYGFPPYKFDFIDP